MSWWEPILRTLHQEFSAELSDVTTAVIRLTVATLLGAAIGYDRERQASAAGLRTHMIVALGAALFVVVPQQAGMDSADVSRIVQGLVAGIGFLGAGTIIKLDEQEKVKGLTTAASIWATAAIAVTAGMGQELTAILATLLALAILAVLPRLERPKETRILPSEPVAKALERENL